MKKKKTKFNLIKETPEERKQRINSAGSEMRTRVVENKKKYKRHSKHRKKEGIEDV